MARRLEVAMVDVGGTLWPNSWPLREGDGAGRRSRIEAAMAGLDSGKLDALVGELLQASRPGDVARSVSTESEISLPAEALIAGCLRRVGLEDDAPTVARIRRAMSLPVADRLQPLPGAIDLLVTIHELGLRTVITSNTYWRDADSYWEDFKALGMASHIDAVVTSVDAGHLKPHPAVFQMALGWAQAELGWTEVAPDRCVVIGNREENDIEPALALGMWAILVHPDDPAPASSKAHAVAPDLAACAGALAAMLRG